VKVLGSLLEWFYSKKEEQIVKKVKNHAQKVNECAHQLIELFKDLNIETKEKNKIIEKINKIENECDVIRRDIMKELSQGELTPRIREDLAHLIKRLDNVADNTNATARRLSIIDFKLLKPVKENLRTMVKNTIESVDMLQELIENQLGQSKVNINKLINKIHKKEHDVDVDHINLRKKLHEMDSSMISPFMAIEINSMVESIEFIADSVEETADLLKILNLEEA